MPLVLPDPDDATRVISSPQTQVTAPSVVPDETSEGATAVGRAITKLGDDITAFQAKRQTRLDESAYSQAVADFELANIQTVDSFTEDRDFANYDTNYTKQIIPKRDEFAKQITNPLFQQRFKNETDISISRARATLHGQGYKIEVQEGRAAFAKNSETYKNLYAIAKDEDARIAATEKYMADFESPNNKEYFNAEERQVLLEAWNEEANVARFNFLPLEEQVAAFKNNEPWLQDIDVGVRAKLKKSTEKAWEVETEQYVVANHVSKITSGGGDVNDWYAKANKISDPEIRGKVLTDLNQLFTQEKNKRLQVAFNAEDTLIEMIDNGTKYTDLPAELIVMLKDGRKKAIEDYASKKRGLPETEKMQNYIDYYNGKLDISEFSPREIAEKFPKEYAKDLETKVTEGLETGVTPEPTRTQRHTILTGKLDLEDMGEKDDDRIHLMLEIDAWASQYEKDKKRAPDDEAIKKWIDWQLIDLHYRQPQWMGERGGPWEGSIDFYEYERMDPEGQKNFRKKLIVPEADKIGLINAYEAKYGPDEVISNDEITVRYIKLLRKNGRR